MNPKLIIVCGLPLTGKSTIAEALSQRMDVWHIDIDINIRYPIFGPAPKNAHGDPKAGEEMREQMFFSYETLCHAICFFLSHKKSVIATATFSKNKYWKLLFASFRKYLTEEQFANVDLKVILCEVLGMDEQEEREEIERRIAERRAKGTYAGGCRDTDHYFGDKIIFEKPLPSITYLILNTSPPDNTKRCVDVALSYAKGK